MSAVDGTIPLTLPTALSPNERQERAIRLAVLLGEIGQIEADLAAEGKRVRAALKDRASQASQLAVEVRTGFESREVACLERVDEAGERIETVRTDTGEVVRTRPLGFDERQQALFAGAAPRRHAPDAEMEPDYVPDGAEALAPPMRERLP